MEPQVIIFGGGGSRGFLHLGFIRAVHELAIPIDHLTGISIGAWAAAFFGMGLSPDEIGTHAGAFDAARVINLRSFFSNLMARGSGYRGFFDSRFISREIEKVIGRATFRETSHDVRIQATDLATGEPFMFSRETTPDTPLSLAVAASSALAGIFEPVIFEGRTLVDGSYCGYLVPEQRPTILSNVSPVRGTENLQRRSILNLMLRSSCLLPQLMIEEYKRRNPRVLEIQHDCRDIGMLAFNVPVSLREELMRRTYESSHTELSHYVAQHRLLVRAA